MIIVQAGFPAINVFWAQSTERFSVRLIPPLDRILTSNIHLTADEDKFRVKVCKGKLTLCAYSPVCQVKCQTCTRKTQYSRFKTGGGEKSSCGENKKKQF